MDQPADDVQLWRSTGTAAAVSATQLGGRRMARVIVVVIEVRLLNRRNETKGTNYVCKFLGLPETALFDDCRIEPFAWHGFRLLPSTKVIF